MFDSWWLWMCLSFFFLIGPWRWRRSPYARWGQWEPRSALAERKTRPDPEQVEREEKREAQIEQLETRVAELESRLDFAERLLATRREGALVPPAATDG